MSQNYLGSVVPQEKHAQVLGRFHAVSNMGFIVGPVIGGHLSDLPGGFQLVALSTTALFLTSVGGYCMSFTCTRFGLNPFVLRF